MPIATAPASDHDRERDESCGRDARPQRPAVQFVERVRGDPHREEERRDSPHHAVRVEVRREGGAHRDVREVPERVRRVEQRDVVAPAASAERVPGGPYFFLRPHVTIPPPSESRFARTSSMPASRQAWSSRGTGHSA